MELREIALIHGNDGKTMAARLLEHAGIANLLRGSVHVVLKPNLVVAALPHTGATTHTELVEGALLFLRDHSVSTITIAEGSWVGDSTARAFAMNGYPALAARYNARLLDTKTDRYRTMDALGVQMQVSETVLGCDFLVNMPVLKGHCQTVMTCALKNIKGCLSDASKRKFHSLGLHRPIAALNRVRCADLVLVDNICGDLDFEEGGNPVQTERAFVGRDSVLIDAYGASLMGFDIQDIPYIGIAEQAGVGSGDLSRAVVTLLNKPGQQVCSARPSGRVRELSRHICALDACSACQGNLVHALGRLDDEGLLDRLPGNVHVGQGWKQKQPQALGVGSCAQGCDHYVPGCPPSAAEMLSFLRNMAMQ